MTGEGITKNAPYAWENFHGCALTRFQKLQHLGRVRKACLSIATSRAQRAEPDLSDQRPSLRSYNVAPDDEGGQRIDQRSRLPVATFV